MKRIFLTILALCFFSQSDLMAQFNYVPNHSFEEYDSIRLYNPFDSTVYTDYYYPTHWFIPVDCGYHYYYNSNLNYVHSWYVVPQNPWSYTWPYDGIAQSGVCPFTYSVNEGLRNYLEVKLKMPLISGHEYCVSFFITIMDTCYIAIDQIGACFTIDSLLGHNYPPNPPCYLLENPQVVSPPGYFYDKRNQWQQVLGQFTAQGGEQFMTIGNFKTDSNTNFVWLPDISTYGTNSYYHIDMVTVIECDSNIRQAVAGNDTTICRGDSIRLGINDTLAGYHFFWSPATGLSDSNVQNPFAKPDVTTTYQLMQNYYSSYYTSDEVTITVIDCSTPPPDTGANRVLYLPNIFSPNGDGQNDVFRVRGENIETLHLAVYNRWGEKVFESQNKNDGWDGNYKGKPCSANVYVYHATIVFEDGTETSRKGNVTLVR
ncbi:MAG: gliding motility-associated C-terminal domain-containing protein [Bacteroidales bacterium]|jgi:gliding motility-associated-like protein|nr:gliding motility-associated C-terminal domain-containing protein [Bacteroidales bacterium]